jgi:hypothetical protein
MSSIRLASVGASIVSVRIAAAMTLAFAILVVEIAVTHPGLMADPMPIMRRVLLGVGLG